MRPCQKQNLTQLSSNTHRALRGATEAIMSDRGFWIVIVVGTCGLFWTGVIVAALIFKGAWQ